MRILITNDDGINAIGIKLLIEKAKKYGEIYVVAPKEEMSATSHAINVRGKIEYKKIDDRTYYVASTPGDCVRFAYYGLKLDFDMIFSGVNKGFNVGEDIWYSGTVAAVFEANSLKKKAIAFSCDRESFDGFITHFDEVMDYIYNNHLFDYCELLNVNFPKNPKGIRITRQGLCNFITYFDTDEHYTSQEGYPNFENDIDKLHYDTSCVMNDYISITPLTSDRTNIKAYEKMSKDLK